MQSTLTRRQFIEMLGFSTITTLAAKRDDMLITKELSLYIGTFTSKGKGGIYHDILNSGNGSLEQKSITSDIVNPSFLTVDSEGRYLYSVSETQQYDGKPEGSINAYRINEKDGSLEYLNTQPSKGQGPCFITMDHSNRYCLVANYTSGSVSVFPVKNDGSLAEASDMVQQHGSGVNPKRQEGPHAHSIVSSPDNRFCMSADLGTDKVLIYKFDDRNGKLSPASQTFVKVKPGLGPRHIVFHPNGKLMYLVCEMGSMVVVFDYDPMNGHLTEKQMISTLPADFKGTTKAAEIQIDTAGRYLYASNRGEDSIVVYSIHPDTGKLKVIQNQKEGIKWPRYFTLDPTGRFLLSANETSNDITVYSVDAKSGKLRSTGKSISVYKPVCIQFAAR